MRTAIYCRISQDETMEGLGVTRQKEDSDKLAVQLGWAEDVTYYIDNDVSATSGKRRPEFQRMIADVRLGHIQNLIVWSVDRLTRTPLELETLIGLSDKSGLSLATVTGETNLATPVGRLVARLLGGAARFEVDQTSARLKRKFLQKAEMGEPHGFSPYGYTRILYLKDDGMMSRIGRDVIDPERGEVVREAARRTLNGESLRSIVADFNVRDIHGPKAVKWNSTILRQILLRPTNAGLRNYNGKILGESTTQPLYDSATHYRLVALLKDPSRRSNFSGSSFKYLLSGLAICGLCGGPMRRQIGRAVVSKRTGATKRQPPSYNCADCYKVRRHQEAVDHHVVELIIRRLSMPDAGQFYQTGDSQLADEAQSTIEAIDALLAIIVDGFADDTVTADQFKRGTAKLRQRRTAAERELDGARPRTRISELTASGDVRAHWEALPIEVQREVLTDMLTVTIHKAGSGKRFDPDLVEVKWND